MNNYVAMGHCFIATKQSHTVVGALIQSRNIETSKRTQSGSSDDVQLHSNPCFHTALCYRKTQPQGTAMSKEHGM